MPARPGRRGRSSSPSAPPRSDVKRFVWLAVALLIASSMLLYMRAERVYAERTTAVPPSANS